MDTFNTFNTFNKSTSTFLASFDIGKKNFAFCIEEISGYTQPEKNIGREIKYNKDGTCTPEFAKVIKNVCMNGRIIVLENIDLTSGCDGSLTSIMVNMNSVLTKYKEYWDKCSAIVIEQQMGFGNKINFTALKLGQHCFSFFVFNYANFKTIVEFPAFHKTRVLGALKKQTKPERKKWAIAKALEILADREDFETIDRIMKMKKRDDVCDTIVQLQSYKYLTYY